MMRLELGSVGGRGPHTELVLLLLKCRSPGRPSALHEAALTLSPETLNPVKQMLTGSSCLI